MRRLILPGLSLAIFAFMPTHEAHAQSCTVLKSQLAKASKAGASAKTIKRYNNAIKQQTKMIAKVKGDLKRYKCGSGNSSPSCKKLTTAQKKMKANLAQLNKKRASLSGSGSQARVRQIKAKLEAYNCNSKSSVVQVKATNTPASKKSNGVRILGSTGGAKKPKSKVVTLPNFSRVPGNYRTLCVRTCDGFYFPISSNTSTQSFGRDELACKLMCPGTETKLFFHRSYGQESQDMISYREQKPYADEDYAFIYRTKAPNSSQACSCNMGAFHAEMRRREAILNGETPETPASNAPVAQTVAIPEDRIDPGEDPETVFNIRGKLKTEDLDAFVEVNRKDETYDGQNKKIRMVGPVFLQNNEDLKLN